MMVCSTKRLSWTKGWLPQLKMGSMSLSLQASLSFQAPSENWLNADCRKEIKASTCFICGVQFFFPWQVTSNQYMNWKGGKQHSAGMMSRLSLLCRRKAGVAAYQMRQESEVLWLENTSFLPKVMCESFSCPGDVHLSPCCFLWDKEFQWL